MEISEIELLGSPLLRFFAIQSMGQLVSYIISTLTGFFLFQAILILFGEPIAAPMILLFAFAGSSVILRMMLPAKFYVMADSREGCAEMVKLLAGKIKKQGYNIVSRNEAEITFQSKLPALLRWNENEITITNSDMTLMVKGPIFIIRMMHRNSSKMLSG